MYDETNRITFLERFEPILTVIINELEEGFDINSIIRYYTMLHILNDLKLLKRYNHRINVTNYELELEGKVYTYRIINFSFIVMLLRFFISFTIFTLLLQQISIHL